MYKRNKDYIFVTITCFLHLIIFISELISVIIVLFIISFFILYSN